MVSGPTRVLNPSGISIGSAIFVQMTATEAAAAAATTTHVTALYAG